MRFSVFTPTHDTTFLKEAYQSLMAQTYPDWEWVVVLNNGAEAPPGIDGGRVRIVHAPRWAETHGVGALKQYACSLCDGEYLVELDHDDLLVPDALQQLSSAIDEFQPDFLYSDAASLLPGGDYRLYDKAFGWEHYTRDQHMVNSTFPITPSSLSRIFYAPDHVRVWRRATYQALGGHDVTRGVCDDFDLVIRTYLSGATFHHIPECLYLYRIRNDGSNTWIRRNAEIQAQQELIGQAAQPKIIDEWCRRNGLTKYDLGSGINPAEGWIGVDYPGSGAPVECNIAGGLPFADNSVGAIRAYDFLEHVPHCHTSRCSHQFDCVVFVMNEIYRVLAPGGWLLLSATPSTDGRGAFQDPTHCSFWSANSFWYYTRQQQRAFVRGIKARFQAARLEQNFPTEWHHKHNIPYVYADLVALKGQRQPGLCEV